MSKAKKLEYWYREAIRQTAKGFEVHVPVYDAFGRTPNTTHRATFGTEAEAKVYVRVLTRLK